MLYEDLANALRTGVLSVLSPCVLPIIPPCLAWLAGVSLQDLGTQKRNTQNRRRLVLAAAALAIGFTTVFLALGTRATFTVQAVARHFDVLSIVAGTLVILMELHFLGLLRLSLLYRQARLEVERKPAGLLGA